MKARGLSRVGPTSLLDLVESVQIEKTILPFHSELLLNYIVCSMLTHVHTTSYLLSGAQILGLRDWSLDSCHAYTAQHTQAERHSEDRT